MPRDRRPSPYALTSRHVAGDPGSVVQALLRGSLRPVGETEPHQLARLPFSEVFPEFLGRRSYLTLDVDLIDVDDVNN